MPIPVEIVPVSVAGVLNLVLGTLLLTLNINHRVNRAFATVMVLRAGSHLHFALAALSGPTEAEAWRRSVAYYGVWIDVALAYFMAVYPKPRRWLPKGAWGPVTFAFAAAAGTLAVALARDAFEPPTGLGYRTVFLSASVFLGFAAAVLVEQAVREPPGLARTSTMLIALGLACVSVQDIVGAFLNGALRPGSGVHPLLAVMGVAWAGATAWLLVRLAQHRSEPGVWSFLVVVGATTAIAAIVQVAPVGGSFAVGRTVGAGLARLLLPLLVAYALLRYQVFDLDVRFRRGFSKGLVPASLVLIFFVVSESAELVVSARLGTLFGLAAALVLLFALRPLERAASRLAARLFPGATEPEGLDAASREGIYRDLARSAWSGGPPSEGERRILAAARARLRVDDDAARRIEREAAG